MSNTNQSSGASFPLFGILGVVFIVLKLTGVIAWSWLWVLAPFWGPLALGLLVFLVALPFVLRAKRKATSSLEDYFDSIVRDI